MPEPKTEKSLAYIKLLENNNYLYRVRLLQPSARSMTGMRGHERKRGISPLSAMVRLHPLRHPAQDAWPT